MQFYSVYSSFPDKNLSLYLPTNDRFYSLYSTPNLAPLPSYSKGSELTRFFQVEGIKGIHMEIELNNDCIF